MTGEKVGMPFTWSNEFYAGDFVTTAFAPSIRPSSESGARHPHLPPMVETPTGWAPCAPTTLAETGLDEWILQDLALKLTSTVPHLTTEWAADRLRLPTTLVEQVFWQLKQDQFVEILGQTGEFGYRYAVTD